jgi:hypothetical protein
MTVQDMARAQKKSLSVSDAFHKTQLHADTATIQHIQKATESMLQVEMHAADNYVSIQIDAKTWWVLFAISRRQQKSPIPAFERVRIVKIDDDGCFHCSCGYQDRYGLPDWHVSHVAHHYGTNFEAWNHQDVDLRYHNTYCMLVAMKDPATMHDDEKSIHANLISAHQKDYSIPFAPSIGGYESGIKYAIGASCNEEEFHSYDIIATYICNVKEKVVAVLNYSESEVLQALISFDDGIDDAARYTQESHRCDNTSNWYNGYGSDNDDPMTFSWDASNTPEQKASSSAYAEAAPL